MSIENEQCILYLENAENTVRGYRNQNLVIYGTTRFKVSRSRLLLLGFRGKNYTRSLLITVQWIDTSEMTMRGWVCMVLRSATGYEWPTTTVSGVRTCYDYYLSSQQHQRLCLSFNVLFSPRSEHRWWTGYCFFFLSRLYDVMCQTTHKLK